MSDMKGMGKVMGVWDDDDRKEEEEEKGGEEGREKKGSWREDDVRLWKDESRKLNMTNRKTGRKIPPKNTEFND